MNTSLPSKSPSSKSRLSKSSPSRSPVAEPLEGRRLFAVNLTDGTLTVVGTEQADIITLTPRGSTLTVRVGAERAVVALDDVDEVLVSSLGGDDRVTLGRLDVPAIVDAGAGDDRVTGGRGDDVLSGGEGNDRVAGGLGDDELFGAAGNDRLLGDAGDDELSGGDGSDLLNGGFGFDSTELGVDTITGVEDLGDGNVIGDGDDDDFFGRPFDGVFGPFFTDETFGALRDQFTPLDTTGFNVRPGTNTISGLFSTASFGNDVLFNPSVGVTLEAGGAVATLPNTGAFARDLGLIQGLSGAGLR